MKIGIICISCEFFSVVGILYALVCGVGLQEILVFVLLMFLAGLLLVRTGGRGAEEKK